MTVINPGANPAIYWQVGTSATLGTSTAFRGNIVALTSITMNTSATLNGRALARNGAVALDTNTIGTGYNSTLVELSYFKAVPGDSKVTLNWATDSETDNAGFNILRSDSEGGTYSAINGTLIPADANAAVGGATYSYEDTGLTNGTTYYYKLQDVDLSNVTNDSDSVSATANQLVLNGPDDDLACNIKKQSFSWSCDGCNMKQYKIQLSTSSDFAPGATKTFTTKKKSMSLSKTSNWVKNKKKKNGSDTFYWRVKGNGKKGSGMTSETREMTL